jgi:DNA-directed RNA polymerase subunit RPC12/RpoP
VTSELFSEKLSEMRSYNLYSGFINTISSRFNTILEGGFAIPKNTKMTLENRSFTCENPKCGRTFAEPVLVEDLASQKSNPYYACPYCLTEIMLEKEPEIGADEQNLDKEKTKTEPPKVPEPEPAEETPDQQSSKPQECPHYFGYLSTRSKKDPIPEECMTCDKLVECMLKV